MDTRYVIRVSGTLVRACFFACSLQSRSDVSHLAMNVANQGAMAGRRTTSSAQVSQVRSRRVDFEGETVPVKWHVLCRSPFFSRRLQA